MANAFMVNNERTVQTRESSSKQQQQNALTEFLQGQNVFVNLPTGSIIANALFCILQSS